MNFDQIASVGSLALNIVSLGTVNGASDAALKARLDDAKKMYNSLSSIKIAAQSLKESYSKIPSAQLKAIADKMKDGATIFDGAQKILTLDINYLSTDKIIEIASYVASIADPKQIIGVETASNFSKCSALTL
jgi:hypothetical protein